jgi:diaminopimelate epimerase
MGGLGFAKMHGCGNDFIMIDGRNGPPPERLRKLASILCDRHRGLGADGLVTLYPSRTGADFEMIYVNASGMPGEMCGNGARCAARFAHEIGLAGRLAAFETGAGIVHAEIVLGRVSVELPPPTGIELDTRLALDGREMTVHRLKVGVPHAVVFVPDIDACRVEKLGPALRAHPSFLEGCNANFAEIRDGEIRMRTYERGVEAETLACGTGAVACATIALLLGHGGREAIITTRSGERLFVTLVHHADRFERVILSGPTETVGRGEIDAAYLERYGLA